MVEDISQRAATNPVHGVEVYADGVISYPGTPGAVSPRVQAKVDAVKAAFRSGGMAAAQAEARRS